MARPVVVAVCTQHRSAATANSRSYSTSTWPLVLLAASPQVPRAPRQPTTWIILSASLNTETQHAHFIERLLRQGYRRHKVHYHTIVLGVGGTVYKSMYPVLGALGVKKTTAYRLASKLHYLAAQYTEVIMQTKGNQEHLRWNKATRTGIG